MFAAELDVSKVYRLSDKSLLHNHAVMWPHCTSLVDDQYPNIFTDAQTDKIQKVLNFKFSKNVEDAIKDLLKNFENGNLKNTFDPKWQNIQVLKNNVSLLNYSK